MSIFSREKDMVYATYYDGSGEWMPKEDAALFAGSVWATAKARRDHWWSSAWQIDEDTIEYTQRWYDAQEKESCK